MRTLFFDIDGTLLISHRAGCRALTEAMKVEFGVEDLSTDSIPFGGRTDRDLTREILQLGRVEATTENRGRLRRTYADVLRQTLETTDGVALPGVRPLLDQLMATPAISLAVMTGNFPETARMKLEAYRLASFFSWIVGGDLDEARDEMARRAAEQLKRRRGSSALNDMIVIGDTVKDVKCAQAIGAACLAVCTGSGQRQDLESAGADLVVEDLTDQDALNFLANGRPQL